MSMVEHLRIQATMITASDPFFIDTYGHQSFYQRAFQVKHEIQAVLPFDGSTLAIGSVNYHQQHFGRTWRIRMPDGSAAFSCCMGFGIDRWCYAIFAQYGLDPAQWPQPLRDLVDIE